MRCNTPLKKAKARLCASTELPDRQVRSLRYQLKAARFPVHRDLTGID
jgi:hypothetical protein